jgi:hypothetical protein
MGHETEKRPQPQDPFTPAAPAAAQKEADPAETGSLISWFLPGWQAGDNMAGGKKTHSDGMTTTERSAQVSTSGVKVGHSRKTEVDEQHAMYSGYEASVGKGGVEIETERGGKVRGDDGATYADRQTRKVKAGKDGVEVGGSSERSDGTTTVKRSGEVAWDKDGPRAGGSSRREIKVDDDHQMAEEHEASVGRGGAKVGKKATSRIKDADTGLVHEEDRQTSVSVGKDGISAQRSRSDTVHVGDESFTNESSYGLDGDKVSMGRKRTHTKKGEDGEEHTDTRGTSVSVGKSGASASHTRERTRADGSTASSEVSGGVDWDKREAHLGGSYGVKGKDGEDKGTVSGAAKVKVDESGRLTDAEAEAGVSKGDYNVSVKGEYHVHASPPKKDGDVWIVEWERSVAGGVGAGGKRGRVAVSGSIEKNHKDAGTRVFHSEKEALTFSKNAAAMIPDAAIDTSTVQGALRLEVGESRSQSDGSKIAGSAAAKVGVGTVGVGGERTRSEGRTVQRVSETVFEVTVDEGKGHEGNVTVGVGPASIGKYGGSERSRSRTVRFDLSTAQGRAAFEEFQRTGTILPGGKAVSETDEQTDRHGQRLSLGKWGSASIDSTVTETHTRDQTGTTDTYKGTASQDASSNIPFMKGHDSMSVNIKSTEHNDQDRDYALHGTVDSSSGSDSRKHLSQLTGMRWEDEGQKVKSSGKWRVDAEITEEHAERFLQAIESERVRDVSIFESRTDDRNELRKALKAAKTSDDRLRALSRYVANAGHDGEALRVLRDTIFGRVGGDWNINSRLAGNFHYDLHLKGDPNFPGIEGRRQIEAKIQSYTELIKASPEGAGTLTNAISGDIDALRKRREAVADPARYTDLPTELRAQQVSTLDAQIDALVALRRQAALAASKTGVGDLDKDDEEEKGKSRQLQDKVADPAVKDLARVRKEVARLDRDIAFNKEAYAGYKAQLKDEMKGKLDLAGKRRKAAHKANVAEREGRASFEAAGALERGSDEMRAKFIAHLSQPQVAASLGQGLAGMLRGIESMLAAAVQRLSEAVEAWETMEESEYSDFSMVVKESGRPDRVFFDRDEYRAYDAERKKKYEQEELARRQAQLKEVMSHWGG